MSLIVLSLSRLNARMRRWKMMVLTWPKAKM